MKHWLPDSGQVQTEIRAVILGQVYVERLRWWREQFARCEAADGRRPVGLPPVLIMADGRIVNGNHRAYVASEFGSKLWGLVVELLPVQVWVPDGHGRPWVCTGNVCQVLPAESRPARLESFTAADVGPEWRAGRKFGRA